jgi:superfamily I DNA/RNA helicase
MIGDVLKGVGQYTAFNSALVAESAAKFQGTKVSCNTTHSLAFRAVGRKFSHRLNGNRVRAEQVAKMLGIKEMEIQVAGSKKRLAPGWLASQVTGAIRRFCQSADREVQSSHFKYVDGIDAPGGDGQRSYANNEQVRKHLLPYAERAWADLSSEQGQLPFSHDHYVKVWQLNKPVISADYILLDEAQDTAPVMLDVLQRQKAVVILVGDSAQQIYEWRGAVNALASFPGAPRRFLSQSFRFGPAIAAVANKVLETLEEKTPLRLRGLPSIQSRVGPITNPQAILCRTNAVAVASLLNAIAEGKKPFLVGGGSDVISFVDAARQLQQGLATNHPDLACFGNWSEVQEYAKMEEGEDLRLMVKLIDNFGADNILSALRAMPAEKDADLVISTAHKSKGREWDSVVLAADFPTVSKSQDSDRKLLYVAVTRAKLELDVSQCPFFTGDDSLALDMALVNRQQPVEGIIPPAPITPPAPADFSWVKSPRLNDWAVRGPVGHVGKTVDVKRKDGSTSKKYLLQTVWSDATTAIYQVR